MKLLITAILALISLTVNAAPERMLDLGDVKMEDIKIQGRIQTWIFEKVCIDGQAYLLISGVTGPNGISLSFKDGKPEECVVKAHR